MAARNVARVPRWAGSYTTTDCRLCAIARIRRVRERRRTDAPSQRFVARIILDTAIVAMPWAVLPIVVHPSVAPEMEVIIATMLAGLAGTLVVGLLFCSGLWLPMLCILPITGWRGKLFAEKKLSVDPSTLGGHGGKLHGSKAVSYQTRTYSILGVYSFNLLCVLWNFGSA